MAPLDTIVERKRAGTSNAIERYALDAERPVSGGPFSFMQTAYSRLCSASFESQSIASALILVMRIHSL